MSKKFWNKLIRETLIPTMSKDLRLASRAFVHDVFFGKDNLKWAILESYQANGFKYNTKSHSKIFDTAAAKYVAAAKKFCNTKKKLCDVTPYSDGFVATIFPRAGRAQTGVHAGAQTYVDPVATSGALYGGATKAGWKAGASYITKELKILAKKGEVDFLHGDDPSAATMGATNKSRDPKSYGVYNKGGGKDQSAIGGRKTTVGSYYAAEMFGQGNMQEQAEKKMSALGSEKYEIDRRLLDTSPRAAGVLQKRLAKLENFTSIPPKTLELFTQYAEKAILDYIDVDLGWKMTRAKTKQKRKIEIVVDGSVGAASSQYKQFPWDMPIRRGKGRRVGIEGRLNEILQKELTKMLADLPEGHKASDIKASETIGEIMESDLAGTVLDTIKKHFKGGKNVKVKVTRKTKKVKDNQSNKDRIQIKKQKVGPNAKIKQAKKAKKKTGQVPIAKSTGRPDLRYKAARLPQHSPIGLTQLLNKALPAELRKNMTGVYPRGLEWRTGRFAESARVTSIVPFPNLTQIQYTYMKDPYEVFEPGSGNPIASSGRDPQQIIGGTIRQLAQSIMGTRFGLVRTKRV